jgi:hypothetical protein
MVFHGHIRNGVVVVDDAAALPDGVEVEIRVIVTAQPLNGSEPKSWLRFSGAVDDLPADASERIDQVLYGRPEE